MKNPRSVVNRIAVVRKKLNVPLVAFNSKNSGAVANGASSPVNGAGDDEDSGASDETKPSKTGAGQKRKSPVKKDTPRKRAAKSRSLAAGKKGAASKAAKVEEETDTEEMAEGESSPLKVESDTDEVGGETGETEEVDHGGDIEMSEAEYAEWKKGKVEAN